MATFRYEAMTSTGEESSGTIEADSQKDAQRMLRSQGLFVTRIKQAKTATSTSVEKQSDRPKKQPAQTPATSDWREVFEPAAARQQKLRRPVLFVGFLGLMVGLLLGFLYLDDISIFVWPVLFGVGSTLVYVLAPKPWPDCPACGLNSAMLGEWCPTCGSELEVHKAGKHAECPTCNVELRSRYWIKAPVHEHRRQEVVVDVDDSGSAFVAERVPVHFCTHCRARLTGDEDAH